MPGRTLSASQVSTWLSCHRKWAFRHRERLPREFRASALAFGSAVHSALDWFHTERLDGAQPTPERVARVFRADWDAELDEPIRFKDGESADALSETGEALVRLYVERFGNTLVEATELAFEVPLVDLETGEVLDASIRGYVDLLLPDDTLVEVKSIPSASGAPASLLRYSRPSHRRQRAALFVTHGHSSSRGRSDRV
ncbi:MAG: PD-(D/E)XK nuclease family protein, partial [Deltaproteobacteria bacterium]|nr:PD-(D/E)XK nuclease family protein [Deltaproteobacteria bacterium]